MAIILDGGVTLSAVELTVALAPRPFEIVLNDRDISKRVVMVIVTWDPGVAGLVVNSVSPNGIRGVVAFFGSSLILVKNALKRDYLPLHRFVLYLVVVLSSHIRANGWGATRQGRMKV